MEIKCIDSQKKYIRTIECISDGLVLFKTSAANRRIGQNYHMFFEDKKKPPLDIAVNPDDGAVEYVSFFAQDEVISIQNMASTIEYIDGLVILNTKNFDMNNTSVTTEKNFKLINSGNDIYVLGKTTDHTLLQAYRLDSNNYLLFCALGDFCGVLLKNISEIELGEIRKSRCI